MRACGAGREVLARSHRCYARGGRDLRISPTICSEANHNAEFPGQHASATSRSFSSWLHRRRRSGPVITSMRALHHSPA